MRLSCALLIVLTLLTGGIVCQWLRLSRPTVEAIKSHQSSRERLRERLHHNLEKLLERKRGIAYDEWGPAERLEYDSLRRLLAEEGESIPEQPDTSR